MQLNDTRYTLLSHKQSIRHHNIAVTFVLTLCTILAMQWSVAPLSAQTKDAVTNPFDAYRLGITRAESEVRLDGIPDEQAWQKAKPIGDFSGHFPIDSLPAKVKTEVRALYDDKAIYLFITCYDNNAHDYYTASLRRDYSGNESDGITFVIDPIGARNSAFVFGVTPVGAQREGLMGGTSAFWGQIDWSWDNKWFAATKVGTDRWTAEIAIPYSTLRFAPNVKEWRINFWRHSWKNNESSTWTRFPVNFGESSLAQPGVLEWDVPPGSTGLNLSVIPYLAGTMTKNYRNETPTQFTGGVGGDLKYAVTSSLNLDVTVNPDFSNADVDRQITNLERFSIFFPERRQFFIENSDLFSQFGFSRIRPFFSRQIGLKNGRALTIPFGVRLSGNVDEDWRVGLMNMTTSSNTELNASTQNYTVAALQRRVFKQSNIGAIFVNRQGRDFGGVAGNDYNRTLGADFNFFSDNNLWRGKLFYHQLFTPNNQPGQFATAGWLGYNTQNLNLNWNHEYIGQNYNPEVGFVPRNDVIRIQPEGGYRWWTNGETVVSHGFTISEDAYLTRNFELLDMNTYANYEIGFTNTSAVWIWGGRSFTRLYFPFDVTGLGQTPLPIGNYEFWRYGFGYGSDRRKVVYFNVNTDLGSYFVGHNTVLSASIGARIQPLGTIDVSVEHTSIAMPAPYNSADFTLVQAGINFTPATNLFFTTFFQYNGQAQNVNLNSRLQWRFAPMSDLFLVYTDNYNSNLFGIKNRGVVMKLVYWFNT